MQQFLSQLAACTVSEHAASPPSQIHVSVTVKEPRIKSIKP